MSVAELYSDQPVPQGYGLAVAERRICDSIKEIGVLLTAKAGDQHDAGRGNDAEDTSRLPVSVWSLLPIS